MKAYSVFGGSKSFCSSDRRNFRIDCEGIAFTRPLVDPPEEAQVQVCLEFLSRCAATKTAGQFSYGLKHTIENSAGVYMSNGACIEAARRLNLKLWVPRKGEGLNAMIGITSKSVTAAAARQVWKAIEREGARS